MKKLLVIFVLLASPAFGQIPAKQSTGVTVPLGPESYDGYIKHPTLVVPAQWTIDIVDPNGLSTNINPTTGGLNRCTYAAGGIYNFRVEGANIPIPGLYTLVYSASNCISPLTTRLIVDPTDIYIRDHIQEPIGGWIAAATTTIIQASAAAVSGGFTIPTTGMTPAQIRFVRTGNPDQYNLTLRGMSKSINEPSMVIQLMNNTGSETPLADENDFTHSSYALRPGIDGATIYAHLFSMDIDDTWVDGKYSIYVATQKDDTMVGMVSELALDPTPSVEIDESNLVTLPTWNDFVEGVTKTFNKWGHGAPSKVQVFYAKSTLDRSQEGVSSSLIRAVTTGVPYGWESLYFDEITNITDTKRLVRDYDASTWDSITVHEISETVENWATMEGVTISDYEIQ